MHLRLEQKYLYNRNERITFTQITVESNPNLQNKFSRNRCRYEAIRGIQVEYGVNFGREVKRADIVVMDKDRPNTAYMIVEVKKPKLKDGKNQLRSYCNATGAPIAVWTNGDQISYYQRKDPNYFEYSGL